MAHRPQPGRERVAREAGWGGCGPGRAHLGRYDGPSISSASTASPPTPLASAWCSTITRARVFPAGPVTSTADHNGAVRGSGLMITDRAVSSSAGSSPGSRHATARTWRRISNPGVVDPDRTAAAERHIDQPLAQPRHSRDALSDQPAGTPQVESAAFVEHQDDAELLGHLPAVHRQERPVGRARALDHRLPLPHGLAGDSCHDFSQRAVRRGGQSRRSLRVSYHGLGCGVSIGMSRAEQPGCRSLLCTGEGHHARDWRANSRIVLRPAKVPSGIRWTAPSGVPIHEGAEIARVVRLDETRQQDPAGAHRLLLSSRRVHRRLGALVQTCLGTCPESTTRMILCPTSALGPDIRGPPPSITVMPWARP